MHHWESPEIKKRQKIDQKFPFWSCQNRFVTSQELPICTTCTCVVQNGKSWLFRTEILDNVFKIYILPAKNGRRTSFDFSDPEQCCQRQGLIASTTRSSMIVTIGILIACVFVSVSLSSTDKLLLPAIALNEHMEKSCC
jgi:hypothetical protein